MRSMTDFIDTVLNPEQLAVYNEDYSWAEEYAEYYNEESDNYAQPILESSGYQFFGEACFIQEASKGLIAGGVLALLSGAFFMIMKLLRNGGDSSSGSSSSSSNNSNKSSDNNSRHSSNGGGSNNNRPPTNPPDSSSPQLQSLNDEKLKAEDIRDKLTDIYEGKTKESSAVTEFFKLIGDNGKRLEGYDNQTNSAATKNTQDRS